MTAIRTVAAALAIAALAASTAQAKPVDTQGPVYSTPLAPSESGPKNYSMNSATGDYTPPAAKGPGASAARGDSPAGTVAKVRKDLRMPDTFDAANGRGVDTAPKVTVVKVPTPVDAPSGGGIDWADAGIGAGGMLAMTVLAGGAALALRRRALHPVG